MKTRLLITAIALASVFGAQQAVAKSSTKSHATSKKHKHKKNKTGAAISAPEVTAGTAAS